MLKKILIKLKFNLYKMKTNILRLSVKKSLYHVAIVSTDKYANKIWDDVYLKRRFICNGIYCDIISWQKNINLDKYDALIVRSIWGFCDNLTDFISWLDAVDKKKIKIFNNTELIKNNIDKKSQFMLMDKYNIEHVETIFLDNSMYIAKDISDILKGQYRNYDKVVIKPSISESGHGTYLIGNDNFKNSININDIYDTFSGCTSSLMLQPFIDGVLDGELSVICVKGKIISAVKRYCNVFGKKSYAIDIKVADLEKNVIDICEKVMSIPEYKNYMYMRIDFVKNNEKYQIIEIELIDPNLFFYFIEDNINRSKTIDCLVNAVFDEIRK